MKHSTYAFTLAACLVASPPLIADDENEQLEIETYVSKLDKINYLPSLLPVIMENSDVIELSDEQMETLLAWRESNRLDIISAMNDVVKKRIAIKEAALSPDVSSARLSRCRTKRSECSGRYWNINCHAATLWSTYSTEKTGKDSILYWPNKAWVSNCRIPTCQKDKYQV